jgi:hypothetical protein
MKTEIEVGKQDFGYPAGSVRCWIRVSLSGEVGQDIFLNRFSPV